MTAGGGGGLAGLPGFAVYKDRPGSLLGLEHEYRLRAGSIGVDFRTLIHDLGIDGYRLDPGDLNAYRLSDGSVLTSDDREAEFASPPLAVVAGAGTQLVAWAESGRRHLEGLLPEGISVEGYSTHLSVAVPDAAMDELMAGFISRFSSLLMLLLEGPGSRGIYVRPRPGRLEICGDYRSGPYLGAAGVFLAGAVRALAESEAANDEVRRRLPSDLAIKTHPARGRYGFYLGRRSAFGFDLYSHGRGGLLPLVGGGEVTIQEQLERAWDSIARALGGDLDHRDRERLESIVAGDRSLGVEEGAMSGSLGPESPPERHWMSDISLPRSRPFGRVSAVIETWPFTIYKVEGKRSIVACVPRQCGPWFIDALADGSLDELLAAELDRPPAGRHLGSHEQTLSAGLWDTLGDGLRLLPRERDPDTGVLTAPRSKPSALELAERAGKRIRPARALKVFGAGRPGRESSESVSAAPVTPIEPVRDIVSGPARPGRPQPTSWLAPAGAAIALIAVISTVVVGVLAGGGSGEEQSFVTPTSSPVTAPTPPATLPAIIPAPATMTARPSTETPQATRPPATSTVTSTRSPSPRPTETPPPTTTCVPGAAVGCTPMPSPTR